MNIDGPSEQGEGAVITHPSMRTTKPGLTLVEKMASHEPQTLSLKENSSK